jgi:(2Fe-2S) ferredoxin
MLKKALVDVKGELALAQKELRGGSSSLVQTREALKNTKAELAKLQSHPSSIKTVEKVVTKVVEPTEKIQSLQAQLNAANIVITQLRNAPQTKVSAPQQPQVVYKDRIVTQEKVVEKIVYKDRPIGKEKIVEKVVYKDRPVAKEKVVEKIVEKVVYKDRPIEKVVYKDRPIEKIVEKVVYKDRPVSKEKVVEKIVEKVVYKDRPVEKIVTKTVVVEKHTMDETTQRKMDKLALELERVKTLNQKLTNDLMKTAPKRKVAVELPPLPPVAPTPNRIVAKAIATPVIKPSPQAEKSASSSKKSSVYRMANNASIYNAPNGKAIDTWEERRSFTGNSPANGWIHITGYFVNRVFQGTAAGENLWVKESDAIRR